MVNKVLLALIDLCFTLLKPGLDIQESGACETLIFFERMLCIIKAIFD